MHLNIFAKATVPLLALVALIACEDSAKSQKSSKPSPVVLDQTATKLPPGVREAWFTALDQAIESRLSVYRGRIVVSGFLTGISYVPAHLLEARCGGLMTGVELVLPGGDDDGPKSIPLLNNMFASEEKVRSDGKALGENDAIDKKTSIQHPLSSSVFGMSSPPLGVGPDSPAAIQLMNDLCRHLVDRIDAMTETD